MKEKKSSPGGAGKNINSINFINRLFGTEKCARTTEIETDARAAIDVD